VRFWVASLGALLYRRSSSIYPDSLTYFCPLSLKESNDPVRFAAAILPKYRAATPESSILCNLPRNIPVHCVGELHFDISSLIMVGFLVPMSVIFLT
jgi:hypothetical protein